MGGINLQVIAVPEAPTVWNLERSSKIRRPGFRGAGAAQRGVKPGMPSGDNSAEDIADGKRIRQNAGTDAEDAQTQQRTKEAELNARNAGGAG